MQRIDHSDQRQGQGQVQRQGLGGELELPETQPMQSSTEKSPQLKLITINIIGVMQLLIVMLIIELTCTLYEIFLFLIKCACVHFNTVHYQTLIDKLSDNNIIKKSKQVLTKMLTLRLHLISIFGILGFVAIFQATGKLPFTLKVCTEYRILDI